MSVSTNAICWHPGDSHNLLMIMFGSFSPEPWLVSATKVYSGVGADIVMESFHNPRLEK